MVQIMSLSSPLVGGVPGLLQGYKCTSSLCNLVFYGQVVGHAETVRQLQAADSARQLLQDSMDVHLQAEQEAKAKQVPNGDISSALADALSASS